MLAGLIRGPEHYSAFRNLEIATERRNLVMGKLRQEQVITEEEYRRGISERLRVKVNREYCQRQLFADYVQEFLRKSITGRWSLSGPWSTDPYHFRSVYI